MGYNEKGFSILQSLIEFNFFSKSYKNISSKLEDFESYWEDKNMMHLGESQKSCWLNQI